jgi:plasmid stabilization system protein ParE
MADFIYHRLIQKDLSSAISHYDQEGGTKLGDRFFDEIESAICKIEQNPTGHHFSDGGLRRVQLRTFPYHFLYEADSTLIRIAVLRHDKRHPNFGLQRKK